MDLVVFKLSGDHNGRVTVGDAVLGAVVDSGAKLDEAANEEDHVMVETPVIVAFTQHDIADADP